MRLGAFQLSDPVPDIRDPYALVALHPWIDVNNVGSLILSELQVRLDAAELGRLAKPGDFYDFTRYRPIIHLEEGIQDVSVPNTTAHYIRRETGNDLLLLRLLEPHAHTEVYIASVLRLLRTFGTKKYILLGSMFDAVPHTRPLLVSGYGMGPTALEDIGRIRALPIAYHGPSSMVNLITKKAAESGIDAVVLIVSLPQYVVLEQDYLGKVRLMEILNLLYDIPIAADDFEKAREQRKLIGQRVQDSPEVRMLLPQLESTYDMRINAVATQGASQLTPEMEDIFWRTMGKDIGKA